MLGKEAAHESPVRGDSGTGGNHDEVGRRLVLGHEHDLAGGAGELQLSAGGGVAEVVGADTLLGRVFGALLLVPVGRAAHAEGGGGSRHVVTVTVSSTKRRFTSGDRGGGGGQWEGIGGNSNR